MNLNPPPIQTGWASDSKMGPIPVWALWFQNVWNMLTGVVQPSTSYVTTTNVTHGGTLTKSMSMTRVGALVTVILTYSDTVSTSSTVGTTYFTLQYAPIATSPGSAINGTTHASLGNGYVASDGKLYPPTCTTGAGQTFVMTVTYFTAA